MRYFGLFVFCLAMVTFAAPTPAPARSGGPDGSSFSTAALPTRNLEAFSPLGALRSGAIQRQVRINQRVIVRIRPRSRANRNLSALLPQANSPLRLKERGSRKCLDLDRIGAVQTGSGNRLILFLRDAGIIGINLEKNCHARDYYAGFYVERREDGKLCLGRDKLHSRNGMKCEIERMRRLVVDDD